MSKFKLSFIVLFAVLASWSAHTFRQNRVEAIGGLVFNYPGAPEQPLFQDIVLSPGQCIKRVVSVENEGRQAEMIAVLGNSTQANPLLEDGVVLETSFGSTTINETLAQFLSRDLETELGTVDPGLTKNIYLSLCLASSSGNEVQNQKVTFDLVFGKTEPIADFPPECKNFRQFLTHSNYQNKAKLQENAKGKLGKCLQALKTNELRSTK